MLHATPLRGCRLRLQIAFAIAPTEIPAASRRRITALPAGRAQAAGACTLDEALKHPIDFALQKHPIDFALQKHPIDFVRQKHPIDFVRQKHPIDFALQKHPIDFVLQKQHAF